MLLGVGVQVGAGGLDLGRLDANGFEIAQKMIGERQVSRLGVVGSNEVTAPVIEESYRRFLRCFCYFFIMY